MTNSHAKIIKIATYIRTYVATVPTRGNVIYACTLHACQQWKMACRVYSTRVRSKHTRLLYLYLCVLLLYCEQCLEGYTSRYFLHTQFYVYNM